MSVVTEPKFAGLFPSNAGGIAIDYVLIRF